MLGYLRSLALMILLLPGLLLGSGGHLRICLHDWLGFQDACSLQVPGPAAASCCAQAGAGPVLASQPDCETCCIDLATGSKVLMTVPQAQVEQLPLALDFSSWVEVLHPADPGRCVQPTTRHPAPACGPGRAPTPLRI